MSKVLLGDVAVEHKETCKGSKDGYPIVGLEHLIPEEITLTAWDEGSENTFSKMFRKGNVLFGRRRAYLKKAAVAPFDGICSGDITVIEAKPDRILPELLPFIIQNDDLFDFAVGKSAGSLSPRVKWEHLKNYEFELPDMEKQKELAELLWAMDNTKKSYQKLIAATDELVKSQFMEQFGDPVANPKGWIMSSIKDVTNKIGSGATPKGGNSVYIAGGVSLIRSMNVYNGYFEPDDLAHISTDHAKLLDGVALQKDDVLLNITGASVARCCIVPEDVLPARVNQHVCILRCDTSNVLPTFLNQQLITSQYQKVLWSVAEAGGGTRQAITKQQIENFRIILPPLALQEQFAAFVRQSDKSKFELEKALSELTATYKRIIAENLG